jgi:hypothetical protein
MMLAVHAGLPLTPRRSGICWNRGGGGPSLPRLFNFAASVQSMPPYSLLENEMLRGELKLAFHAVEFRLRLVKRNLPAIIA